MLIKIILGMAILIMFLGGVGAAGGITGLKTAISDKQLTSTSAVLDKAIVRWYTSHDYELPAALNAEVLSVMGLRDIDLSKFTYTKLADNKYSLVVALSGKTEKSINSDRDLPLKPAAAVPSSSGSSSTTTPSTPDTGNSGNTGDTGDTGTTTPDTGNTGDSGSSGGTSGGSSGDSGTTTPDTGNTGDSGNSGSSSGNVSGSDIAPDNFVIDDVSDTGWLIKTINFGNGATYNITVTGTQTTTGEDYDSKSFLYTASGLQKFYFEGTGNGPSDLNSIENGSGANGNSPGSSSFNFINVVTGVRCSFDLDSPTNMVFTFTFTKKS